MSVAAFRARMAASASFNPLSDWATDPVHAFWASDPLWTPNGTGATDAAAVVQMRNGGTGYTQGAYLDGTGLVLPGSAGNYASSADAAALDITGDIDLIAKVSATDWTPAENKWAISKWTTTGNQRSYALGVTATTGTVRFVWSADGINTVTSESTIAPTVVDGGTLWIRAALDVDDGGVYKVYFYTSSDGSSWSQLGSTVTGGATTSVYSGSGVLSVGSLNVGTSGAWAGTVFRTIVKSGIAGTTVFDADFSGVPERRSAFLESSSNAALVTIRSSVNPSQDTGASQPTYRASVAAYNNKPAVEFDTTDDSLSATFTAVTQPFYVLCIGSIASTASSSRTLWDGTDATNRALVAGLTTSNNWAFFGGTSVVQAGTTNTNAHLFRSVFNGASSVLDVDEGADEVSGDGGSGSIDSVRLGASSVPHNYGGGYRAYWALFSSDPTADANWSRFKAWVTSFYGISLGA